MSETTESGVCAEGIGGMQVLLDLHTLDSVSLLKRCSPQEACH